MTARITSVPGLSQLRVTWARAAEACSDTFLLAVFEILSANIRKAEQLHVTHFPLKFMSNFPSATQQFHCTFADAEFDATMSALAILSGQRWDAKNEK